MKTLLTSKTIWTFLLLFVVAILNQAGITNLPLSETANWIVMALSFIAIILRLITKEPINWGDSGKFRMLLILILPLLLFAASPADAQVLMTQDSIMYKDSTLTFTTSGYNDFYLQLYNNGSDSTVTCYVFDVDYNGNATQIGFVDYTSTALGTMITSVALAPSARKIYHIPGGHYQIKVLFSPTEGATTRIDCILTAYERLNF